MTKQEKDLEVLTLEVLLIKLEKLELQMVELDIIEDGDDKSDIIGTIKEDIYDKIREISNEQIQYNKIDTGAGFQGNVGGDGLSGFRG
jgi:hypothetical protein